MPRVGGISWHMSSNCSLNGSNTDNGLLTGSEQEISAMAEKLRCMRASSGMFSTVVIILVKED